MAHVAVVETTSLPQSRWCGHQLLGVWSRNAPCAAGEASLGLESLDLRGLGQSEIAACLALAKQGLSTLLQERETVQQLKTQLRQQQDEATFRFTELNNQLIRATTELNNELIRTKTELNNDLVRTTTELNNEIWRINVNAANELAEARASLSSAEARLSQLRKAVSAHNERLAAISVELRRRRVDIELAPCELGD